MMLAEILALGVLIEGPSPGSAVTCELRKEHDGSL
jgi:hypothetical protein